ncbi:MAG: hypothetical protein U1E29_01335, partial [Coriobacteriia bacterium]|nr:hypothetical protein [Coriobacteriia bacterium]
MNNYDVLQGYSKGDLRRLAKGKISEIVGLDADKILRDLSRVLGNYESVKRHVEFRNPPADTILEVLLEADGRRIRVDDLKPAVRRRIREYQESAKGIPIQNPAKGYRLYAVMLAAAWDHDGDLVPPEANLLRVLRDELGVNRRDHQLIMAHPEVGRLIFNAAQFDEELTFLSNEGIVLVCNGEDGETYFVISDETAESLLQLWGFEMDPSQARRLFLQWSKGQLVRVCKSAGLRVTGSVDELVDRILVAELKPSDLLGELPGDELGALLAKIGLRKGGNKEERILRVLDYFRSDTDIATEQVEEEPETVIEERVLSDESLADLLDVLGVGQLAALLEKLEMPKSGAKNMRIERLVQSPYNSETILQALALEDLKEMAAKLELKRTGRKGDLVAAIIDDFRSRAVEETSLTPRALLDFYVEISEQDRRAYPDSIEAASLSVTRIGLDFERATRYIFKNMLNLDTKVQRSGRADPDGVITDDEGYFYCYECKTVLAPPYTLPIQHRLQIRNYITAIAASRRADRFGGYLIIAHSFDDKM